MKNAGEDQAADEKDSFSDIKKELEDFAWNFDKYLKKLLAELDIHKKIREPISYTLLAGGKRIRPFLASLTCEMLEGDTGAARRYGAALEFIHTYSLIHDDLPCMDDDEYRRGKKTSHTVFGEGMAVLAGDALQTLAFKIASGISMKPERRCQLIEMLADAAGPAGMIAGQALDLRFEDKEVSLEKLQEIHAAKTGELFRASIIGGALCGSFTGKEEKALEEFALQLGLTFQIVDDILDVTGDSKSLGKKVGKDQDLNKATYPALLGLEKSRQKAGESARRAKKALGIFEEQADDLKELVNFVVNRQY